MQRGGEGVALMPSVWTIHDLALQRGGQRWTVRVSCPKSPTTHTHPVIKIFLGVKAAPSAALPDAGHKSAADSAAATEVPERGDMH